MTGAHHRKRIRLGEVVEQVTVSHPGPDAELVALLPTEDVEYVLAWSLMPPVTLTYPACIANH
jgi:hypothetical protein